MACLTFTQRKSPYGLRMGVAIVLWYEYCPPGGQRAIVAIKVSVLPLAMSLQKGDKCPLGALFAWRSVAWGRTHGIPTQKNDCPQSQGGHIAQLRSGRSFSLHTTPSTQHAAATPYIEPASDR